MRSYCMFHGCIRRILYMGGGCHVCMGANSLEIAGLFVGLCVLLADPGGKWCNSTNVMLWMWLLRTERAANSVLTKIGSLVVLPMVCQLCFIHSLCGFPATLLPYHHVPWENAGRCKKHCVLLNSPKWWLLTESIKNLLLPYCYLAVVFQLG